MPTYKWPQWKQFCHKADMLKSSRWAKISIWNAGTSFETSSMLLPTKLQRHPSELGHPPGSARGRYQRQGCPATSQQTPSCRPLFPTPCASIFMLSTCFLSIFMLSTCFWEGKSHPTGDPQPKFLLKVFQGNIIQNRRRAKKTNYLTIIHTTKDEITLTLVLRSSFPRSPPRYVSHCGHTKLAGRSHQRGLT